MRSSTFELGLFSSAAFFLRTFTYVCSTPVNERVLSTPYVLCVGRKNAALEINPKTRFKRRTTHDAPNLMQMSLNKIFFDFGTCEVGRLK